MFNVSRPSFKRHFLALHQTAHQAQCLRMRSWMRQSLWLAGPLVLLTGFAPPGYALSVADYAVQVSARVQTNPPQITLTWPADPDATGYTLYRKQRDDTVWGTATILATNGASYVDSNVVVGATYEYQIRKTAREGTTSYNGVGYILAGMEGPLVEFRGKVILLVESTYAASLSNELTRLQLDLAGDGWTVLRRDVWRTNTPPQIKAIITNDYYADPQNVKSVLLFGRVPVPYSGSLCPDGHGDHCGAWPADVYYGDVAGTWTDSALNTTNASRVENRNQPGDGKFDQTTFPAVLKLQVGRVDFYNLPAFAEGERELLRRYLNKHHNFRLGYVNPPRRGLVDEHFGTFGGEAFGVNGYRNFAPFFGYTNILARPWFATLQTNSYLWGYACGGGSYTSEGGVGTTTSFVQTNTQVIFTMHFGSYFGDYDSQNNLMRAQLANAGGGLTCAWAGRPHWQFHQMALGETIGFSALISQNYGGYGLLYDNNGYQRYVHVNLLGDPTLRMHIVRPPSALSVAPNPGGGRLLRWNPSPDTVLGYHVYGAPAAEGPFTRLNASLLSGNTFADPDLTSAVYMARAVKLETSASGTYYNASQGIFENVANSFSPPAIALAQPANGATQPLPARVPLAVDTTDANNDIVQVRYYTNGVLLGTATNWPYSLDLVNPWLGNYAIAAVALDAAGFSATSSVANLTVTYSLAALVPAQAVWKYDDTGVDLGTAWRAPEFDDSHWASGPAQLGFGDDDEATPINTNRWRITTYFRKAFVAPAGGNYLGLTVRLLRDDGGVVYLNGTEVFRSNMRTNLPIYWGTQALSSALPQDESTQFYDKAVALALLHPGTNWLAVEIHQYGTNSSDLSFVLELAATNRPYTMNTPPVIALQNGPLVQAMIEDNPSAPVYFTVGDAESWLEGLVVTAHASNTNLVPDGNYLFGGDLTNRSVIVVPATNAFGNATITLDVFDGFTNRSVSFDVTVAPVEDPPVVSLAGLANGALISGSSLVLTGDVFDAETNVSLVEFFINGLRVSQDDAAPYRFNWTNVAAGYYTLGLRATDATGLTGEMPPILVAVLGAPATQVSTGAVWRYHDLGQDLGTAWREPDFNDAAWSQGRGPLGYGDASGVYPVTRNGYGTNAAAKYITTYYRHSFVVTNASLWTNLVVNLQRDDGAIIYLNGVEVFRSNMPTGLVTALTLALTNISGTAETNWHSTNLTASLLREGLNVLAAEVHQNSGSSSDIFFNLELTTNRRLQLPTVAAAVQAENLKFAWPAWAGGLRLFSATNLTPPVIWTPVTNATATTNNGISVVVPADAERRFFQLRD
jgi:hypothetical protein